LSENSDYNITVFSRGEKMKKILQAITSLLLIIVSNCSSWRKSELPHVVSWTENEDTALVYKIIFEERSSWNPLNGTTIKASYQTVLKIITIDSKENKVNQVFEKTFDTWVLPGMVFYKKGGSEILMISGTTQDSFGTEDRNIIKYNKDSDSTKVLWSAEKGKYLWKILPSPDGQIISFVTTESAASMVNAQLHFIIGSEVKSVNIDEWIDSPNFGLSWEKNSKTIFIRKNEKVEKVDIANLKLVKASSFPDCFYPGTNIGSIHSPKNNELIIGNFNGLDTYKLQKHEGAIYFSNIPRVSKFSGKECY
ncbi:MAG: hypothetical protein KDK36_09485, partial [Leptospiraceae bacterium]|nr:hypothetical protein [Leptospiraceae bacterium]